MSYLIKDLPDNEKPREKFKYYGAESLTTEELIAIILRCGTSNMSVKDLAIKISKELGDLTNFQNWSFYNLINIKGVGEAKAITLLAAIELGRRTINNNSKISVRVTSGRIIYELFKYDLALKEQEHLIAVFLNTKKEIITYKTIFIGTINKIIVHPREIFYEAIKNRAVFIILLHNHPSGDPTPSQEDVNFTKVVKDVGRLMQIPLIDHIIIGNNKYYSFYDNENGD